MHINKNLSGVFSVKLWELEHFPCSVRCRSAWIRELVDVRVVVLDSSRPMATKCGMWLVLGQGRSGLYLMSWCTTTASSRLFRGSGFPSMNCLTAEPSSLWTPTSGPSGHFVDADRQDFINEGIRKSARPYLLIRCGPSSQLCLELVSQAPWIVIVNFHSSFFSLSLSLSLSLYLSLSLSLSLSLAHSLSPLSVSLHIVMHRDNLHCGNLKPCDLCWVMMLYCSSQAPRQTTETPTYI